jgi:hypothetical protein
MAESHAFATMTCRCGRSASASCPSLAGLPAALATLPGWGWDERGFVRCPECKGTAAAAVPDEQGELLL